MNGHIIEDVPAHTYLGLKFAHNLRWNHHINDISIKARRKLNLMIPLKFKLDRKSLEIMYKSFVQPTMEYAISVWGGTFDSDLVKLERIHVDGMRLITGATARSNIANVYEETKFMSISERRDLSMLIMVYKIKNGLTPGYLVDIMPRENHEYIRYNLRNNQDISVPYTRLEIFRRSFVPFAINLWNKLSQANRNEPTLLAFKNSLLKEIDEPNILYFYGNRWPSIHHSRLRIGCSKLNHDLYYNLHVVENASCACGALDEDVHHFFFECPNYLDLRMQLFNAIIAYTNVTLETILHGNDKLSLGLNKAIFDAVHLYIERTERFI